VSVSGATLYFAGGVNWDQVNNNLSVGDQFCGGQFASCAYAMTVSGSTATVTGSTPLSNSDGSACDVAEGVILRFSKNFAGPCITAVTGGTSIAGRWAYPAGGDPVRFVGFVSPRNLPTGAAISYKY
jgi:hypothetical protein